jgi:hypothetical protein
MRSRKPSERSIHLINQHDTPPVALLLIGKARQTNPLMGQFISINEMQK